MSKKRASDNISLTAFDDLFGAPSEGEQIVEVALKELHEFQNHPFRVLDDEKMYETVASVKEQGIIVPGIVRPRKEGGYEIIAGHRRKRAAELAGLKTMPVYIREYSDELATRLMVDTNIQREDILPSEKAHAYRMKYDQIKSPGVKGNSLDELGNAAGESGKTVQRYTSQKYRLEDNIAKNYPQQISALKERIAGMKADIATYNASKPADKDVFTMTVAGKTYDDRKEAGTAIIGICKEMKQANVAVPIGEYLGMKMNITFDSFFRKFTLNMKGKLSHEVEIGSDPSGNITRIGNAMESMTKQLEDAIAKHANVEQQLETAKIEVEKPFPQEKELNDKLTRLAELNSLLDMDEKGEDAVDLDEDAPKPEKETAEQTETVMPAQEATKEAGHISEDKAEISEKAEEADISETEDMGNPATKPETKEERPSLVARLNEKKAVVAAMDQKAPAVAKKKEEVIA